MSEHFLTVGKAAELTGVAKSTISDAIKKGRISVAGKTPRGYQIDPAELFRVFDPKPSEKTIPNTPQTPNEPPSGGVSIDQLIEQYEARLAEKDKLLEREREALRREQAHVEYFKEQAIKQNALLKHYQEEETKQPPKRGLWGLLSRAS